MEFQGAMAPAEAATMGFYSPSIEAEEHLTEEKVKKLKRRIGRWSYNGMIWQKMVKICALR